MFCPTHFQIPHIYGLPKTHKGGVPLRPIVSLRESLFAPISRHLADILAPYGRDGESFVSSSSDLISHLHDVHNLCDGLLVSFDVESLFTNVPVDEVLSVIKSRLEADASLTERTCFNVDVIVSLLHFCLTSCYFLLGKDYYIMTSGVAMGSGVSCVVANIYMFFFEEMALESARNLGLSTPSLWLRYVDDVLARFDGPADEVQAFLSHINSLRPSIRFTVEFEQDNGIPFLDVQITKSDTGVRFSVFRKPTHSNAYLNRESCHPKQVFSGLIFCLANRARNICSDEHLKPELDKVFASLVRSGFTSKEARRVYHTRNRRDAAPEPKRRRCFLPYVPGLSDKIRHILGRFDISTTCKPPLTLGGLLLKKRPVKAQLYGLVYRIPCADCSWSYVGETGRTLKERVTEHKRAVRNWNTNSEIVHHLRDTGHCMDWSNTTILDREKFYCKRIFKESWWSSVFSSGNRRMCEVDEAWNVVM